MRLLHLHFLVRRPARSNSHFFLHRAQPPNKKARRGAAHQLEEKEAEVSELKKIIYDLRNSGEANAVRAVEAEFDRRLDQRDADERKRGRDRKAEEKAAVRDATFAGEKQVAILKQQNAVLTKEASRLEARGDYQRGTIGRQMDKVQAARAKAASFSQASLSLIANHDIQRAEIAMKNAEILSQLETATQEQLDAALELNVSLKETAAHYEAGALKDRQDMQKKLNHATDQRRACVSADASFIALKPEIGLRDKDVSVPPRGRPEHDSEWPKNSIRHMAAVLNGRGEGDDINHIADALHRCGYLERLIKDAERPQAIFRCDEKAITQRAVDKIQSHWTARHAVHVWDRLELTRSQMETLHHLLTFIYDPVLDKFVPIRVWENPDDSSDFVLTAKLASRCAREKEYREIAATMNIKVGDNGRCERDAIKCTSLLYSNYAKAL